MAVSSEGDTARHRDEEGEEDGKGGSVGRLRSVPLCSASRLSRFVLYSDEFLFEAEESSDSDSEKKKAEIVVVGGEKRVGFGRRRDEVTNPFLTTRESYLPLPPHKLNSCT